MATFDIKLKSKVGLFPVKLNTRFRGYNASEIHGFNESDARFLVERGAGEQVKPDEDEKKS